MLHTAVLIKLLEHMPLLDEASRFLPEEDTPDMKTQLDSQDFPQPGDHQSRNQTKKSSVHCKKGDRRDPDDITENQKPNTHRKGSIAKRGDIITQAINIPRQCQLNRLVIKFRVVRLHHEYGDRGRNDQDQYPDEFLIFIYHALPFGHP